MVDMREFDPVVDTRESSDTLIPIRVDPCGHVCSMSYWSYKSSTHCLNTIRRQCTYVT